LPARRHNRYTCSCFPVEPQHEVRPDLIEGRKRGVRQLARSAKGGKLTLGNHIVGGFRHAEVRAPVADYDQRTGAADTMRALAVGALRPAIDPCIRERQPPAIATLPFHPICKKW